MGIFNQRMFLLVLVLGLLAAFHRWRTGTWSRAREYGMLLAGGLAGGVYGAAHNAVGTLVSLEYYIFWKGLTQLGTVRQDAVILGFQAGIIAGIVIMGLLLWLLSWRGKPGDMKGANLVKFGIVVLLAAVCSAGIGALLVPHVPAARERMVDLDFLQNLHAFLMVWGMHIGSYFGAGAAAVLLSIRIAIGTTG